MKAAGKGRPVEKAPEKGEICITGIFLQHVRTVEQRAKITVGFLHSRLPESIVSGKSAWRFALEILEAQRIPGLVGHQDVINDAGPIGVP